ncbi:MAG: GntR family transcriptional regulator [Eggerthellaceae bacterium]|nr:GntR family transcriptional regulator [Eggerthellaceae bacterium]
MFPFEIDETTDVPLWVQLRQRIAYLINSGYFKPGDKLPTVRGLASETSINYNTVNKAYLSLVSDGYLESTRGRGVFVTDIARMVGTEQFEEVEGVLDDCIASCRELGMEYDDIERAMSRKIKRLKYDEAQKLGEVPGGRIVDFEQSRMQADMGAPGVGAEGSRAGAGAHGGAGEGVETGAETRAAQVKGA